MKTLYDVLDKEEKKNIKAEFKQDKREAYIRFIRIRLTGIVLLIISIYLFVSNLLSKNFNYYFGLAYILFGTAGIFFIVQSFILYKKELNRLIKSKKKQNKKS